jgi:vacuolar protein sorting-associated protein 13A/C
MSLRFDGSWRELCEIPVDEEGQYTFSLQDTNNEDADTLMFEVILRDNVKVIVLRSTFLVVNKTLYPIEVMVADASGRQVHSVEKIGEMFLIRINLSTIAR